MSLLIKALQKAEDEKIADGKTGTSGGELSLEPKSSENKQIDTAAANRVEPAASPGTPSRPQQVAAGVFSAKLPLDTVSGSKKILLIGVISLLLLLLVGMQVYSYINSFNQSAELVTRPSPSIQPPPQSPAEPTHPVVIDADGAPRVFPVPGEKGAR